MTSINIKNFIPRDILMLLFLSVALTIARVLLFHSTYFVYLLWNLFLAILPFALSLFLLSSWRTKKLKKSLLVVCGIFWLLLLPNAPYLVTDMIHLGRSHSVPLIYDTFLIFSSALVGILLGMYSLSHIEEIIRSKYSNKRTSWITALILLLASFGMYLGRFLRFNSWDVLSHPALFINSIFNVLLRPAQNKEAYIFTGLSFIFMFFSYKSWKYSKSDNIRSTGA